LPHPKFDIDDSPAISIVGVFHVRYLGLIWLFKFMSEAKAQAQALADGFLASLGDKYDVYKIGEYPTFEEVLMYYGTLFNQVAQQELESAGAVATGAITELITPKVTKFGNDYEMILGYDKKNPAAVYYRFVDKGVKGFGGVNARPKNVLNSPYKFRSPYPNEKMIKSLEEWYKLGKAKVRTESQKKNLSASQSKNKKISSIPKKLTLRDIATMTAFAIKRDGLRTTNFVGKSVEKVFDADFYDTIALALTRDIDLQVKQMVNKTNNNGNNN